MTTYLKASNGTVYSAAQYATAFYLSSGAAVSGGQVLFPIDLFVTASYTLDRTGATVSTAIAVAHATGLPIYYSPGIYRLPAGGINMSSGGIVGAGTTTVYNTSLEGVTLFLTTSTSSNVNDIQFNTNPYTGSHLFRDFSICVAPGLSKTAGYLLAVGQNDTASISGQGGLIDNVTFLTNNNSGIAAVSTALNYLLMQNCGTWHIDHCDFGQLSNNSGAAITVQNDIAPDDGDSSINNCNFATGTSNTTSIDILQKNSGGLKITGCKGNGGGIFYQFNQSSTVTTSTTILIIANNSIENKGGPLIQFINNVSGTSFGKIVISANQGDLSPCMISFEQVASGASNWGSVVINGNVFDMTAQSSTYNNAAINLKSMGPCCISGNNINLHGLASYGVWIDSTCQNAAGNVGMNNITQPYSGGALVQNNASWHTS